MQDNGQGLFLRVKTQNIKHTLLMLWASGVVNSRTFCVFIRAIREAQTPEELDDIAQVLMELVKERKTKGGDEGQGDKVPDPVPDHRRNA